MKETSKYTHGYGVLCHDGPPTWPDTGVGVREPRRLPLNLVRMINRS